jgi:type IV secretion system protein VirD4
VKRPLIPEGDLSNIAKDTSYLFVSGMFPMKLEKAWQSEIFGTYIEQFNENNQTMSSNQLVDSKVAATVDEEPLAETSSSVIGGTATRSLEEEWNQSEHLNLDFDESELETTDPTIEEATPSEHEDIQQRLKEKEASIQNFF